MTDERLRLTAEMRDRLTPGLRRLQQVMGATGRVDAFRRLARDMSLAERAGYRLGFALGRTVRLGAIGAAAGLTVASAAFVKFGKDSADALDAQAKLAKQTGFTANAIRTLTAVADLSGLSQEGLASGLSKFNTNLGRLKQNQGQFYTYLQKTNPALRRQFKTIGSTQEAFILLSDAISKTTDPSKRAALLKAAGLPQEFARLFADGPDALRATIADVKRLQGLLPAQAYSNAEAFADSLTNIGLAWKGLRDQLAGAAFPIATPMLNDLADFMAKNRVRIAEGFGQVVGDIASALKMFGGWIASPEGGASLKVFWSDLKDIASALAAVAKSVNEVVHALGGWKVVIGTILAVKAGGKVKDFLSGVIPGGAAAPAAAGAAGALGWLGKGGKALRVAGRFGGWLAALGLVAEAAQAFPGFADLATGRAISARSAIATLSRNRRCGQS